MTSQLSALIEAQLKNIQNTITVFPFTEVFSTIIKQREKSDL